MSLSKSQQEVLEQALQNDGRLIRWKGGFWTFEGAKSVGKNRNGLDTPEWYCATNTIFALVRRGYLVMNNGHSCFLKALPSSIENSNSQEEPETLPLSK